MISLIMYLFDLIGMWECELASSWGRNMTHKGLLIASGSVISIKKENL